MLNIPYYDVVVVGGGVSGSIAALASARTGAKTLVLEQYGFLGGTLTNAGVGPMMTFHAGDVQVVRGIAEEVVQELIGKGASPGHIPDSIGFASSVTPFDSEMLKFVLQEKVLASAVDILFHSTFTDCSVQKNRIESIRIATKSGLLEIRGKVFVDSTGDGDLAARSQVPFLLGRPKDNLSQPVTMNAKIANVDLTKVKDYMKANPDQFLLKDLGLLDTVPRLSTLGFVGKVKQAKEDKEISFDRDVALFFETNNPGEVILNMTRIHGINATDVVDLTKAEIEGRRQVQQAMAFLRKDIPGFANCILLSTGPHIGIRESRKIQGLYTITTDDLVNETRFPDTIAVGGYPIDIHQPDGDSVEAIHLAAGGKYYIPYRTMVSPAVDNLIVNGRCISSTHKANSAIRVSPIAMAIGHAAGIGAALASLTSKPVYQVPTTELQTTLLQQNAYLG